MKQEERLKKKKEAIVNLYIELSRILSQNEKIKSIKYYEKMSLLPEETSKYLFELDILIVEKEKVNDKKQIVFELYDDENNNIGKVEDGKIHFNIEYLELIKQRSKNNDYLYNKLLELDCKIEYKDLLEKNKTKDFIMKEQQIEEYIEEERYNEKEKNPQKDKQNQSKNQNVLATQIAKQKGIQTHNMAFVKDNSYLYRNHPEIERNLFFYRGKDGVVKAEYIDENGNVQPSKYIENSKSYMKSVISIGKDGEFVEKEVPYQFMTTNIQSKGANVREIGISINLEMGYLDIQEARLGSNGEWITHGIEIKGKDYNSQEINEKTDLSHKSSNPNEMTDNYKKIEKTGFNEDGIQLNELNLEEVIEKFVEEGYQKDEAIDIINYMIGEEKLSEEKAKDRVNEEIKQKREAEKQERQKENAENEIEDDEIQIGHF